jgi:NAD(P)H-hydrate epimerase
MTLSLPKTGLLPEKTGNLLPRDTGIPKAVYTKIDLDYRNPFGINFRVNLKSR